MVGYLIASDRYRTVDSIYGSKNDPMGENAYMYQTILDCFNNFLLRSSIEVVYKSV